jgi:hypothetical protein
MCCNNSISDTTGKYIRDGAEVKSSDESLDEEKQKKLWELSGGYTHLEGFEPLEAPAPPPEPVKEEPKPEQKPEETAANGDAAKAAPETEDNKTSEDANKTTEDTKEETKDKAEEENKAEEKKDAEKENEEEKKEEIENKN